MIRRLIDCAEDVWREMLCGIQTGGETRVDENQTFYRDPNPYQYLHYSLLDQIFRRVENKRNQRFLDYGCGKGRVICEAARYPFLLVTGVEMDGALVHAAKKNVNALRGRQSPIEILHADALTVVPSHSTVLFFYNPFGSQTMKIVAEKLEEDLRAHPRSLQIIYCNPLEAQIFEECSWLERNDRLSFEVPRNHGFRMPHVFFYQNKPLAS